MTDVAAAIDEMLSRAAEPRLEARVLAMRAAFEARTGSYSVRDSFFEARSAAFWDDALTRSAFGRELTGLGESAREVVEPLARAHRGIFHASPEEDGEGFLLVDEWSGAEFVVHPSQGLADQKGLRDALERATSLVDGRVVGVPRTGEVVLLPGAVFHAADALEPMRALFPEARAREMKTHDLLDALLRMDHSLRALSRVKAAFAYRKEALKV